MNILVNLLLQKKRRAKRKRRVVVLRLYLLSTLSNLESSWVLFIALSPTLSVALCPTPTNNLELLNLL